MAPNWDEESPKLRENLARVLNELVEAAQRRDRPTREQARRWQTLFMKGLGVPNPRFVGAFRGEPGLEHVQVRVGANYGVDSLRVAEELTRFEEKLQSIVAELDPLLPVGHEADSDERAAILDLCAWAHAEWVRIHPFANGSGRTARLWANSLALRYGLPPFVLLRPRPDAGYTHAGVKAMQGDWKPTAAVFRDMLDAFLKS
ncbi:MAG TPA: Fic family protein [Candidatus Angelobacter sp.]